MNYGQGGYAQKDVAENVQGMFINTYHLWGKFIWNKIN